MITAKEKILKSSFGNIFTKTWIPLELSCHTPLLMLHDSLGCVALWRDFPEELCRRQRRPVIAYDRSGFGRSARRFALPQLDFVQDEAATVLPELLEHLELERFVVFDHSVDGAMAVQMAAEHRDRCAAVIAEAAQAFVEDRTLEGIRQAKATFAEGDAMAKLAKYHGMKADWVFHAWTDIWLSRSFADWNLAEALRRVECPVLAIHGRDDEYGSERFPTMICELSNGPSTLVLLDDCGHVLHREQPTRVLDIIERFLHTHRD